MTPGVRVAGGPAEVSIPVPGRTGDMIVGMDMWVARDDGKVTARIEPTSGCGPPASDARLAVDPPVSRSGRAASAGSVSP